MIEYLQAFIQSITRFGIENAAKRYYSLYPAVVLSNEDPDKRGRITVKCEQLFGENPLPNMAIPRDFRYAGNGYGEFYPPEVDDVVWIEFEFGDPLCPVYSGGSYAKDELPEQFAHADGEEGGFIPKVRGIKTKYGHLLLFDEQEDKQKIRIETLGHFFVLDDTKDKEAIYLVHKSGAQMQINEKGDVNVISKDGNFMSFNAENKAVTIGSGKASVLTMDDKVVISDGSGKAIITMQEDKIQITTSADAIIQANSATIDAGAVTVKSAGGMTFENAVSKLKIDQAGLIGLGSPAAELLNLVDQHLDAFINQPQLVMTGVGASSPLLPPAMTNLIAIKALLAMIKGSV